MVVDSFTGKNLSFSIRIVGIVLVRNEDRFVELAVRNALPFCDQMIFADHESEDRTSALLQKIVGEYSDRCHYHRIHHPRESHELIKPFVGTPAWIFGIDGDEIYDPQRLTEFRLRLLSGEFNDAWMILGNVLHCDSVDLRNKTATGFIAPPSRSITKLYNFNAISSWDGDTPERLHGGRPIFQPGFHGQQKYQLYKVFDWEASPLRCLHTCFMRRSSLETTNETFRENIMETYHRPRLYLLKRWFDKLSGRSQISHWKRERYARGERTTVSVENFLS